MVTLVNTSVLLYTSEYPEAPYSNCKPDNVLFVMYRLLLAASVSPRLPLTKNPSSLVSLDRILSEIVSVLPMTGPDSDIEPINSESSANSV